MHGYSGHTYKFVREDGEWVYVQVHIRADGGFKVFTGRLRRVEHLSDRVNADYGQRDLC
jgi:catalase